MTDEPSTQEGPCPRCGGEGTIGGYGTDERFPCDGPGPHSTTQEAEKALDPWYVVELAVQYAWEHGGSDAAFAALRSLRTQHTEQQAEIERLALARDECERQFQAKLVEIGDLLGERTKDREEIERLKADRDKWIEKGVDQANEVLKLREAIRSDHGDFRHRVDVVALVPYTDEEKEGFDG